MASALSPKLVRRGLEIFAAISAVGFAGLLLYGNNLDRFIQAIFEIRIGWFLLAVGLASLDWFGGGMRLWVLLRHLMPRPPLKGSILAGGMGAWGSLVTPSQTGGGPMMIYTLHRHGVAVPEATISVLMTFVATIIFYALAGPIALFLGAGRSLEEHDVLGQTVTLYDLFLLSLAGFVMIGLGVIFLIVFPKFAHRLVARIEGFLTKRGKDKLAERVRSAGEGIDRSHELLVRFFKGWGWGALAAAVVLSGAAFANRLVAGYVVLRMLGIEANFVDVLLLQTLISFLLYFAPTPGGSGIAEVLSAAVMSIYVPRDLTPSYILLWRLTVSYLTVAFGSGVFWYWLRQAAADSESDVTSEKSGGN